MKTNLLLRAFGMSLGLSLLPCASQAAEGWPKGRQQEKLGRGLIGQHLGDSAYLSWRLLDSDPPNLGFDVFRRVGDEKPVKINSAPIVRTTDFVDKDAPTDTDVFYHVVSKAGNSAEVKVNSASSKNYLSFNVGATVAKVGVGDLDGDGEYDYVLRTPKNNIDPNGNLWHKSPTTYKLKAFKSNGTHLWTHDLGWNIELGTWYAPFIVYDFDGDGKAEVAAKTASMEKDFRDEKGKVDDGPEYLSIIDGLTGKVVAQSPWPNREGFETYNHRSRNQLGVAFLDGKTPSIIAARGTYRIMKANAVQYRDGKLATQWEWDSHKEENPKHWYEQGSHSMHAVDVDGDGKDEVILGNCALDDDGTGLWTTRLGHPDHTYIGDIDPTRPGLEMYLGNETGREKNGVALRDPATGELIWGINEWVRHAHREGLVSDIDPNHIGMETYSGEKDFRDKRWFHSAQGKPISHKGLFFDNKIHYYAVYWDADPQREVLVRDTLYNFPEKEVEIVYSESFKDWWKEWNVTSTDKKAERGTNDGAAHVKQQGDGTWVLRKIKPIPVKPGERYRITATIKTDDAAAPYTIAVIGMKGGEQVEMDLLQNTPSIIGKQSETEVTREFTIPDGIDGIRPAFTGGKGFHEMLDVYVLRDENPGRGLTTMQGKSIAWGDFFGDWREEIVVSDDEELRIYFTNIPATDRRPSLMQDPIYRLDVAVVAMGYPQVPTTSYNIAHPAK